MMTLGSPVKQQRQHQQQMGCSLSAAMTEGPNHRVNWANDDGSFYVAGGRHRE
jgi:hypothetical protein